MLNICPTAVSQYICLQAVKLLIICVILIKIQFKKKKILFLDFGSEDF